MPNPFDLSGKVAVVTGASRGLGRAMAVALAEAGATVALASRDRGALDIVRAEVEATGAKALTVELDIRDRASVEAMVERVADEYGRLDVLVNNAGILQLKPFLEVSDEELHGVLETNLVGAFRCTQAAGRLMVHQGHGKIINISSSAGIRGRSHETAYSASKGALNSLTLSLAVEWARYGIHVNAVCPAYFETPINREALQDERLHERIVKRIPLRRIGAPAELAPTVVFLAAPASDYITGQLISVDGGTTAK